MSFWGGTPSNPLLTHCFIEQEMLRAEAFQALESMYF